MKKIMCLLGILIPVLLTSCYDNEDHANDPINRMQDPEGTVSAELVSEWGVSLYGFPAPDTSNIYLGWLASEDLIVTDFAGCGIYKLGKTRGLGGINIIPVYNNDWPTQEECKVGYGYIVRYISLFKGQDDPGNQYRYLRLFVEETVQNSSGQVIGVKVKYQYPFSL